MTGRRLCAHPGCREMVGATWWMCRSHWLALPWNLRQVILRALPRPGQAPTRELADAHRAALEWIKNRQAVPLRDAQPAFSEPTDKD